MKRILTCLSSLGLLAFFPLGPAALAQPPSAKHSSSTTASSDTAFVKNAAAGGLAEVKLGQLAEKKGASEEVRDFGKRMATDHAKANEDLQKAAQKENVKLPGAMNKADQATYDRLSKLSGKAFDRAYANDMVKNHKADVAAFRRESTSGKQDAIKTFAAQTLPTLESHLKQAEKMLQSTKSMNSHPS